MKVSVPVQLLMSAKCMPACNCVLVYRLAEEKWKSRFSKTARENYREMGLLSISVVEYTRKNGQFVIDL